MSPASGESKLALAVGTLSTVGAGVGYLMATTGGGEAEAGGYTRMFFSFLVGTPTLIVGGCGALMSARAWYVHHQQGEAVFVPALAMFLSVVGIVVSLLI